MNPSYVSAAKPVNTLARPAQDVESVILRRIGATEDVSSIDDGRMTAQRRRGVHDPITGNPA